MVNVHDSMLEHHCEILKNEHIRRKMITLGSEIVSLSYHNESALNTFETIQEKLTDIDNIATPRSEISTLKDSLDQLNEIIEKRVKLYKERGFAGIPTGFGELNKITGGGWQNGNLIIVGQDHQWGKQP